MTDHVISYVRHVGSGLCAQLDVAWTGQRYTATAQLYAITSETAGISRRLSQGAAEIVAQKAAGAFRWSALYRLTDDLLPRWQAGKYDDNLRDDVQAHLTGG